MTEKDISILLKQMKNIILNKPIEGEIEDNTDAAKELQEAVSYLSHCLMESNQFVKSLAEGNLEVDLPGRHNFLASELKQLHASLKHITWQTNQVLKGDYKQRIEFMGEFSGAFNEMVVQLEKREIDLKSQANSLISIVDSLRDWVVVTEEETGEFLYTNQTARIQLFKPHTGKVICGDGCRLVEHLKSCGKLQNELQYKFKCEKNKALLVKSYPLFWRGKRVNIHLITDITHQIENEALKGLAYKDELTGLNNRRNCFRTMKSYRKNDIPFSLCMIDLDGLKYINDQFGHLEGDEYLKTTSRILKENTRKNDFACRFGGDEFVVLMPDCQEKEAEEKMARIDKIISNQETKYPMSMSYGVVYVSKEQYALSEEAFEMADEKMYRFKRMRKRKKNG